MYDKHHINSFSKYKFIKMTLFCFCPETCRLPAPCWCLISLQIQFDWKSQVLSILKMILSLLIVCFCQSDQKISWIASWNRAAFRVVSLSIMYIVIYKLVRKSRRDKGLISQPVKMKSLSILFYSDWKKDPLTSCRELFNELLTNLHQAINERVDRHRDFTEDGWNKI